MKNILILTFLSLFLFGCKSYVQVFNTNSTVDTNEEGFYVHENDSLKITYSFWKEKGLMTFSIYNKLDIPIYIDWKKSSYIDNAVKLNYWSDELKSKAMSLYSSYLYSGPLLKPGFAASATAGTTLTTTVRDERITFIPPLSYYYRSQFYVFPERFYRLDKETRFVKVPRRDRPEKTTKVYQASFTKHNSPLIFRNFLTFSLSENFETEFYIDNEFYIDEVFEMENKEFGFYKYDESKKGRSLIRDENGEPILFSKYKKPSSFFIKIPKERGVKERR
jgi:hypothetical protein